MLKQDLLYCLLVFCGTTSFAVGDVPVFSGTQLVKGSLIIPYAEIDEPFEAWYDQSQGLSRIDYYGGMAKTYQNSKSGEFGSLMKIVPVTTEKATNIDACLQANGSKEAPVIVQSVLPDLTGFKFIGNEMVNGITCEMYRLSSVINDKVNNYTMFVTYKQLSNGRKAPVPVMYEMKGYNSLLLSHYDHYYISYSYYSDEQPDPSVFSVPENMTCGAFPGPGDRHRVNFNPMSEFIHNEVGYIDNEWTDFKKIHGKEYNTNKEHLLRKHIFHQNYRYIQSKNRQMLGFSLAVNHLADRSSDELKSLLGFRFSSRVNSSASPFPADVGGELPESWDWRLYGAVTPVKDQSVCGSCWSFGTTGTIEGAYFLKTGHQVRLSQQALVDCSWGFGNNGCDGGEDFRAYNWMLKHGGLPSEADYGPYLGQDGYCHMDKVPKTAVITGFVNVPENDEKALKTALTNFGPISVAIDASHKSLSFYSHGIYFEEKCGNTPDELDHAVLLVGYGDIAGNPYWLIKNSWSTYWGNDGYVLMSRKNNNCGVMTTPTYVTM